MIRSLISVCVLLGCLLLVNKWLHESVARRPMLHDRPYNRAGGEQVSGRPKYLARISRPGTTTAVWTTDQAVAQDTAAEPTAAAVSTNQEPVLVRHAVALAASVPATAHDNEEANAAAAEVVAGAASDDADQTIEDWADFDEISLDDVPIQDAGGNDPDAANRDVQEGSDPATVPPTETPDSGHTEQTGANLAEDAANPQAGRRERDAAVELHRVVASPGSPPLPPELVALRAKVRNCLAFYYDRPLNTRDDSAWSVMHSFLGFGVQTTVALGAPNGRRANAIGWLCWNGQCAGRRLLYLQNDRLYAHQGPGFEGHPGQFMALLAQCRVRSDYPIKVQGRSFTVADLVEQEKRTCRQGQELTFKLIGLVTYLPSDAQWKNDQGQSWDLPRLIKAELESPISGATCGGTHRIMGLDMAVHKRQSRGEPVDGQWLRAKKYIDDYRRYAFRLQNPDGSFSSDWFRSRSYWGGVDRKLQTTGHILEWLVYSLPEEELFDPRLVKSVNFLSDLMIQNRFYRWEVGPRGHAIRALFLYNQRAFDKDESTGSDKIARRPTKSQQE